MVSDIERSLQFYKEVLGFEEEFRFGNYVGLKYGPAQLHLSQHGNPNSKPVGGGVMYVFCDEVDDYYKAITSKGAHTQKPPQTYDYGMRDFVAEDPDGNYIGFGVLGEECGQEPQE